MINAALVEDVFDVAIEAMEAQIKRFQLTIEALRKMRNGEQPPTGPTPAQVDCQVDERVGQVGRETASPGPSKPTAPRRGRKPGRNPKGESSATSGKPLRLTQDRETRYVVSVNDVIAVLAHAGEPLTAFKIQAALKQAGVSVTDKALDTVLVKGQNAGRLAFSNDGKWHSVTKE